MILPEQESRIEELILKEMDGACDDGEFMELEEILRQDPEALDYYLEFVSFCAGMCRPGEMTIPDHQFQDAESIRLTELWLALAEDERTAETIEIEKTEPVLPVPVDRNLAIASRRKVSRFSLYTAMALAAASLLLIAYVITHPRNTSRAVAKLTGSTQAVWRPDDVVFKGEVLYTDSILNLVEGFAEITFDNQAKIIVQSPAEIKIEDDNQIFLRSGKLSAVVPAQAKGFVVRTLGATIVDYGTEFGVTANEDGNTEAHVFLGEVELRDGSDPVRFETGKRLTEGQAGRVIHGVLSKEDITASPASYVRELPVKERFGIPGKRLDLADIVGGGNGFGTGEQCIGIDPVSGRLTTELVLEIQQQTHYQYCPVPENPAIDGVFVPMVDQRPPMVTSQQHLFEQCPATNAHYWCEITNRPITSTLSGKQEMHNTQLARLRDVQYGTLLHPAIMMHANTGITFDLDAIRSANPGTQIHRFTSLCGISDTLNNTDYWNDAKTVLWVLIDGRQHRKIEVDTKTRQSAFIDINLTQHDRFLTLVATDGNNNNEGDWTLFGDPALELKRAE